MTETWRTALALTALLTLVACHRSAPAGTPKPDSPPAAAAQLPAGATPTTALPESVLAASICGAQLTADRGSHLGQVQAPTAFPNVRAHFLAFGDSGTGEPSQFAVAAAMRTYCGSHPCKFAIHTGDIFYPTGASSTTDSRLRDRFEVPYAPLGIPIYMSLGNHDYYMPADPNAAVAYTRVSPSRAWRLPARYHTFVEGGVRFLALDTNQPTPAQEAWALDVLAQSRKNGEPWVIAYGHHPRTSDSRHGDADGDVAEWLDRVLCHRVDVLISGHDHALEVMRPHCGTHQIVTGAGGADLYGIHPTEKGQFLAHSFGFVAIDAQGPHMRVSMRDQSGQELCAFTWQRAVSAPVCAGDGVCNGLCAASTPDPDCATTTCTPDGTCNFACMDDPDCGLPRACGCDHDPLICEVRAANSTDICGCDPACQQDPNVCTGDGVCDAGCPSGRDPDCH